MQAPLGPVKASTKADKAGRFTLSFPAQQANETGQTLMLTDTTGSASWSDILVGDVWLCSGQSNMEFPLDRAIGGPDTIANARDPPAESSRGAQGGERAASDRFRQRGGLGRALAAVAAGLLRRLLLHGAEAAQGHWRADRRDRILLGRIADPRVARSRRGANASTVPNRWRCCAKYGTDPLGAVTRFAPDWQDWWRAHNGGSEPWRHSSGVAWQPVPAIGPWTQWTGSQLAGDAVGNVLLRRTVELTAAEAKAGGTLSIGIIDDGDMTFVNGHPVGNTFSWDTERHYPVPGRFLHAGHNDVLIVATNGWGPGGFQSAPDRLGFAVTGGQTIPLAEGWQYAIATEKGAPPRAPWDTIAGIGGMSNGMVEPLGPMRLAGGAWYQGESDAGIPGYTDRLAALFGGWRKQFGAQMRMLVVQLPAYGARTDRPVASGWAEVREAERAAVAADGNAALASAIDLGAWDELHPPNKLEVGNRLALAAEGKSMPMPLSAQLAGDTVIVRFGGVEGALQALGGPVALGFELCGEAQESCRYVLPTLSGSDATLPTGGGPATRVRYAWADAPVVNLVDRRELPVPGFELPVTK